MKPVALAIALLLAPALPAAASLTPVVDPVRINPSSPCRQRHPDVTALAGGGFIASWIDDLATSGRVTLLGRRLDAEGRPLGDVLQLDDGWEGYELFDGEVAAVGDGGFVALWEAWDFVNSDRVFIRSFDGEGRPAGESVHVARGGESLVAHDLAIDPFGRPVVVWSTPLNQVWLRLFDADLTPRGEAILVADLDTARFVGQVAVAVSSLPYTLVMWEETSPTDVGPPPLPASRLRGRIASPDGELFNEPFTISDGVVTGVVSNGYSTAPAATSLADGAFALAWAGRIVESGELGVLAQLLDPATGFPLGEPFRVSEGAFTDVGDTDLVADPLGGFVVAWRIATPPPPVDPLPPDAESRVRVFARQLARDATPVGGEFAVAPLGPEPDRLEAEPALASAGGRLVAVWREYWRIPDGPRPPFPCLESTLILARTFALQCEPSDTRLCLQGGRFAVEVRFEDSRAPAVALSGDSGTFWFFHPDNVEVLVKVLDGRPVNGHFWVFAGSLSNVRYAIDVTDTITGETRTYDNPQGRLASLADTAAFADPPSTSTLQTAAAVRTPWTPSPWAVATDVPHRPAPPPGDHTHPIPTCDAAHILCLHGGRFQAQVTWRDPRSGDVGTGRAGNLTAESGTFWFFNPSNVELVLKVLDGRPVNGHFWVFAAGLTDVEFTLTVEDVDHHAFWSLHNPPYTLTSHADTAAFPGSPGAPWPLLGGRRQ